jgi:hypothetical protein
MLSLFQFINPLKTEFSLNNIYIYIDSVSTSQETHHVTAKKPNQLILFEETVAVLCENCMKHTSTFCGKNAEF